MGGYVQRGQALEQASARERRWAAVEAGHGICLSERYGFQPFCQAGGTLASMRMKATRQGLPLLLTQA